MKEIWLPKSTTEVWVTPDGRVTVQDKMVMESRQVGVVTGFAAPRDDDEPRPTALVR